MSFEQDTVNELLEDCKGKLSAAVVAGFDENGNAFISSSVKNIPYMHWVLNRAIFELGLFEKQNLAMEEDQEEEVTSEDEEAPELEIDSEAS
jgi:U3 small nucleolar ribonucleoprotein component